MTEEMVAESIFVVEATSCEQQFLWGKFSNESLDSNSHNVSWEDFSSGAAVTVGHLDGRPVVVSFNWARINGQLITFYEAVSQVVDYVMVDKWLKEHFVKTWDSGTRRATCDASNFHLCLSAIKEANDVEK